MKPWIKLTESLDQADYDLIQKLEEICTHKDQTTLKLELDYKLRAKNNFNKIDNVNEFMYFKEQQLIGYIGIFSSMDTIEVNGMVHPEYRRQGIFMTLFELVIAEWLRRDLARMLLLSDRKSNSGQQFIKKIGAKFKFSEYEMYLNDDHFVPYHQRQSHKITLRKATNADADEVARQNAIYFNDENVTSETMELPEEEEKRGVTTYIAVKDQQVIGKVKLQLNGNIGGIYGLGVLPEFRKKGYGRAILMFAVEKLKQANANEVMLQVEAENANALNLYKSCGFVETSTMDYYELKS